MAVNGFHMWQQVVLVVTLILQQLSQKQVNQAAKPSLPESGRYTFTGRASIKAEAKVSSPELAYYDKGMSVNYDKVLTADGHTWLSYMTVSGARRYVDIA